MAYMANRFESFSGEPSHEEVDSIDEHEVGAEGEVDDLLAELPEELADRFEDAHRDLSLSERRDALKDLLDNRKRALRERIGSRSNPEHVAVIETSPLALVNMIQNIEEGPHEKLGEGKAGRVVASARFPNTCYKVMFPEDRVPKGTNDIATEADLQDEIAMLGEISGVRAPKVFSFIHEGDTRAITMERLEAVSMRDVMDGKEPLPVAFDADVFMDRLGKYITELNMRGYYHRDLHEGNVMINKETAVPYVIDFGYAKFSPIAEDAYDLKIIESGHSVDIVLPSDTASLKRLREKAGRLARGTSPQGVSVK